MDKEQNIPSKWWERDNIISSTVSNILGNESISEDHINAAMNRLFEDYTAVLDQDTLYALNKDMVPSSMADEKHEDIYESLSKEGSAGMKKQAALKFMTDHTAAAITAVGLLKKAVYSKDLILRNEALRGLSSISNMINPERKTASEHPFRELFKQAGIEKLYSKVGNAMESKYRRNPDPVKLAIDIRTLKKVVTKKSEEEASDERMDVAVEKILSNEPDRII